MSNPLSVTAARIIDPILTTVARGYTNAMFVYALLFPIVSVMQRGGKVVEFDADAFSAHDGLERAPGADMVEAEFGYSDQDYSLQQRAISGKVPLELAEEAQAVPGIDLGRLAVQNAMAIINLGTERAAAKLATTSANYTAEHSFALSGSSQWDHADSTPAKYVESKKGLIASDVGMNPNVMIVGEEVCRALRNNPDVIDRVKHTQGLTGEAMPTVSDQALAQYFDVEKFVVARARSGSPGSFSPVWGKNVVMAYSAIGSLASMGTPSFGYTYQLRGGLMAEQPWYDASKRSWQYPVLTENKSVIAGKDAGVLLSTVVE